MKTQYKEIFKLKRMLDKAGIPYEFEDHSVDLPLALRSMAIFQKDFPDARYEHYQICYPRAGEGRWISVIEGFGTYGGQDDRLEIMGGLTPYEEFEYFEYSSKVIGGLTANNVFKRIQNHYKGEDL